MKFDNLGGLCTVQIEILLGKSEKFDELMAAAAEQTDAGATEEQS